MELAAGHLDAARDLLLRSLRGFPASYSKIMVITALEGLATAAAADGHHDHAAALLGFTAQMRTRWRISPPAWQASALAASVERSRAAIGPTRAERALARGRHMDIEEAIHLAEMAAGGPTGRG